MSAGTNRPGDSVRVRSAPWVSWVAGGSTITLFDDRDGSYHALNQSASLIWVELGEGGYASDIGDRIAARHPDMAAAVKRDVADLIAEALRLGLLVTD